MGIQSKNTQITEITRSQILIGKINNIGKYNGGEIAGGFSHFLFEK